MNIVKPNKFAPVNNRHIYDALYGVLLKLKPKYCLEIGTFHGQSVEVFQTYFNEEMPDGKLITCDIKNFVDMSKFPNCEQVLVHPHVTNSEQWHYVKNEEILPPVVDSVVENVCKIKEAATSIEFDFCFLDGDHQKISAYGDLAICELLLKQPQYILFDDIDSAPHESQAVYEESIKDNPDLNVYDFSDWGLWVGAALIWNK